MVQKAVGRVLTWPMRAPRNALTAAAAPRKFRSPRSKTGSSIRELTMYENGTPIRRRILLVANSPHCVSPARLPSGEGASSRGPHSKHGLAQIAGQARDGVFRAEVHVRE